MPMINLIEEQRLAAIKDERKAQSAFLTFVGAGVLTAIAFGFFSFEKDKLHREEARMKADIQKLAPVLAQIDSNTKESADLSPRLTTLEEAQKASGPMEPDSHPPDHADAQRLLAYKLPERKQRGG